MQRLETPKSLAIGRNLSQDWKVWKQQFTFHMQATKDSEKSHTVKYSILLNYIRPRASEVYNTFTFESAPDNMKFDKIMEKIKAFCSP